MAVQFAALAFTFWLAGQFATGFSVSFTVTVKVQVEKLVKLSVAVTVTVVVPTSKNEPDAGLAEVLTKGQLSKGAGILKLTIAPHCPGSLFWTILVGQLATGSSSSVTITLNIQLDMLPAASVAVTVTGVVPNGKVEPDGGLAVEVAPGQASVGAGIMKLTTAAHCPGSLPTL